MFHGKISMFGYKSIWYGGFLSHGGTPKKHPAMGIPHDLGSLSDHPGPPNARVTWCDRGRRAAASLPAQTSPGAGRNPTDRLQSCCHAILYYDIYIYIIIYIWYMIYDIWYHAICSMVLEYVPTVSYYVILGVNVGKYFIHGAFRYRIWYIYRDTSILYVTCYDIWLLIYPIYRYMSRTMIHIYSIQCGKDVW